MHSTCSPPPPQCRILKSFPSLSSGEHAFSDAGRACAFSHSCYCSYSRAVVDRVISTRSGRHIAQCTSMCGCSSSSSAGHSDDNRVPLQRQQNRMKRIECDRSSAPPPPSVPGVNESLLFWAQTLHQEKKKARADEIG